MSQRNREFTLEAGDGNLINCAETGTFVSPSRGRLLCVGFRAACLRRWCGRSTTPSADRSGGTSRRCGFWRNTALWCWRRGPLARPDVRRILSEHVWDSYRPGAGRDGEARTIAGARGYRAARLRAMQADILDNLGNHNLGVDMMARRHRMTPRNVHRLFESAGKTFSGYVLDLRLSRARDMLGRSALRAADHRHDRASLRFRRSVLLQPHVPPPVRHDAVGGSPAGSRLIPPHYISVMMAHRVR